MCVLFLFFGNIFFGEQVNEFIFRYSHVSYITLLFLATKIIYKMTLFEHLIH